MSATPVSPVARTLVRRERTSRATDARGDAAGAGDARRADALRAAEARRNAASRAADERHAAPRATDARRHAAPRAAGRRGVSRAADARRGARRIVLLALLALAVWILVAPFDGILLFVAGLAALAAYAAATHPDASRAWRAGSERPLPPATGGRGGAAVRARPRQS